MRIGYPLSQSALVGANALAVAQEWSGLVVY